MTINGIKSFSESNQKHLQSEQISIDQIIQLGGKDKFPFSGTTHILGIYADSRDMWDGS
jgi:hypothetical protein